VADVSSVPQIAVKAELCTQKRGAQFRNKFFSRIIPRAKAILQIPIKARPVGGPMGELVENRIVKMIRTLECRERWHGDEISAWHIVSRTVSFPYVRAS
jgi:hypothetical protein